jgi:hypothetical protein
LGNAEISSFLFVNLIEPLVDVQQVHRFTVFVSLFEKFS